MPTDQECNECEHYKGKDRGVGDKVHKALHMVGIDKLAKAVTKKKDGGCGCGKRRAKLNNLFPSRS